MRTCCICGKKWKTSSKRDDTLIYGCPRCSKGAYKTNIDKGYFKLGEVEKRGRK